MRRARWNKMIADPDDHTVLDELTAHDEDFSLEGFHVGELKLEEVPA